MRSSTPSSNAIGSRAVASSPVADRHARPFNNVRLLPPAVLVGAVLASLPALLYVYMPRPPVAGSQFLAYPAMAGVLGAGTAFLVKERPIASRTAIGWLLALLLYSVVTGISFIANAEELRGSALAELFRPAIYGIFLAYGYTVALNFGERVVARGLVWAALAILFGQVLLAATQVVGMPVFGLIYESDKSRPFGLLLRVTGSLGNPNAFAWIITQAAVIVSLMHRSRFRSFWIGLATLLILFSGSRTLLLLFPFMIGMAQVVRDPTNIRIYVRYLSFAVGLIALFAGVIVFFGEYFPYLAQLRSVVASGSLASVNSFAMRLEMWARRYAEFRAGGVGTWLLGLGSRESTAVMDNDFLYVFFRLGVLGVVVHFGIIIAALTRFLKARSTAVGVFGAEYVLSALVFGLVSETTASWHVPLIMFALLGMVLGSGEMDQAEQEASAPRIRLARVIERGA